MLSSVSYVCLSTCAGMWVISGAIYSGILVLSFISVLLFQQWFLFVVDFLLCLCVLFLVLFCTCFQVYYVVESSGCGSLGSGVLQSLSSSLPDVALASRAPSTYSKFFFFLQQMEVLGTRTWLDSFPGFSISLCYLFASFNDWGEDSISLGVNSS